MTDPALVAAIQPWIDAYNAPNPIVTGWPTITFPSITVSPAVARLILKVLTGEQDV